LSEKSFDRNVTLAGVETLQASSSFNGIAADTVTRDSAGRIDGIRLQDAIVIDEYMFPVTRYRGERPGPCVANQIILLPSTK